MKVVFSNRAYASVLAETTEKIKTETGGLFLGTIQDDTWYIIEAIDPGPKSIFEIAYFEYDQKYTQHLINKVANLYDKQLSLIGLWHRHPGSFDQFSATDDGTNMKYASMRKEGAISALVNLDPAFRITMYQVHRPCLYQKIAYDVGDNLIPDELLQFKTPDRFFSIMNNLLSSTPSPKSSEKYYKSVSLNSFMNFIVPALKGYECTDVGTDTSTANEDKQEKLIDEIIDDLTFMANNIGVETAMSLEGNCIIVFQEAIDKTTKIYFMFSQKQQSTAVSYNEKCYLYHRGLFTEAFGNEESKLPHNNLHANSTSPRKPNRVVDSVIKIIKLNRNED